MQTFRFRSVLLCIVLSVSAGCKDPARNDPSKNATSVVVPAPIPKTPYTIPSTGQSACYSTTGTAPCLAADERFPRQDAASPGPKMKYRSNPDGTVTDEVTGLIWTKAVFPKTSLDEALGDASKFSYAGATDWRVPTVKELYSLINFDGYFGTNAATSIPFINTRVFDFSYASETESSGRPELGTGQRFLDVQLWSSTEYVSKTMGRDTTVFGVNFADGRIKGYPKFQPGSNNTVPQKMFVRYVRGKLSGEYGSNDFKANGDGTVTDRASGLMWQQVDDGIVRHWQNALKYCAALSLGGRTDWRLPNAKELQGIVAYDRSPITTTSAAISAPLKTSTIESYYWTSTTLLDGPADVKFSRAVYIAFGRALGWIEVPPGAGAKRLLDVHGAGAQRSDFKEGDPAKFPQGFGPQGDDVRIANYVRCVRGGRS
jgi:hypothetical protein